MNRAEALMEKPFSLSLSSGFFGYFAHLGFVKAFEAKGLKPSLLSGSSSGAIVAAGLASGRTVNELEEIFLRVSKDDFWDPTVGFGYLKGQKIEQLLNEYCVPSFEDVKIPLHISVFNIRRFKTEVFSAGSIAKACRASAAVPLLFHPVRINEAFYWDGGIRDRAGHRGARLSSHVPVIHYLESKSWISRVEDKFFYGDIHKHPFFFRTVSQIRMGPTLLHHGKDVIEHFQQKTSAWLEESV